MRYAILGQELSIDELEAAAGGGRYSCSANVSKKAKQEPEESRTCIQRHYRHIYEGFANCAATVEDGSYCKDNDACRDNAVIYEDMVDCYRSWQ